MTEQLSLPIEWKKGQNDLEFFSQMSIGELLVWLDKNPEEATYYAREVLYQQECEKYRGGAGVRPETKIIFTIGGLQFSDLGCTTDFAGNRVRTKAQEDHWKAPELHELVGVASVYMEGKNPDVTEAVVFSEVVDLFYNLLHLQITDPEKSAWYSEWVNHLAKALELDLFSIIKMLVSKYHTRMFKNGGKNNFNLENELIESFIAEAYQGREDINYNKIFTKVLRLGDLLNNIALENRLKVLKKEYRETQEQNTEETDTESVYWYVLQMFGVIFQQALKLDKNKDYVPGWQDESDLPKLIEQVLLGEITLEAY